MLLLAMRCSGRSDVGTFHILHRSFWVTLKTLQQQQRRPAPPWPLTQLVRLGFVRDRPCELETTADSAVVLQTDNLLTGTGRLLHADYLRSCMGIGCSLAACGCAYLLRDCLRNCMRLEVGCEFGIWNSMAEPSRCMRRGSRLLHAAVQLTYEFGVRNSMAEPNCCMRGWVQAWHGCMTQRQQLLLAELVTVEKAACTVGIQQLAGMCVNWTAGTGMWTRYTVLEVCLLLKVY